MTNFTPNVSATFFSYKLAIKSFSMTLSLQVLLRWFLFHGKDFYCAKNNLKITRHSGIKVILKENRRLVSSI